MNEGVYPFSNREPAWNRYATAGGSANAWTLTHDQLGQRPVGNLGEIHGIVLRFRVPLTPNADGVTLAVDGQAAKALNSWDNKQTPGGFFRQGQIVEVVYDAGLDVFLCGSQIKDTAQAGACRNLIVKAAATGAADDDLVATADSLVFADTLGFCSVVSSFSATLNPTGAGVNGFDTGAPVNGTWYYLWAIYQPGTGNMALLGSASATAPVMPSGWTAKALIGEWYYETTTNPRGIIRYLGGQRSFEMVAGSALPAVDTNVVFAHRLGVVPKVVQGSVVCSTAEFNYAVGDVIPLEMVINDGGSGNGTQIWSDATNVTVLIPSTYTTNLRTINKTTFAIVTLTKASWRFRVVAMS